MPERFCPSLWVTHSRDPAQPQGLDLEPKASTALYALLPLSTGWPHTQLQRGHHFSGATFEALRPPAPIACLHQLKQPILHILLEIEDQRRSALTFRNNYDHRRAPAGFPRHEDAGWGEPMAPAGPPPHRDLGKPLGKWLHPSLPSPSHGFPIWSQSLLPGGPSPW